MQTKSGTFSFSADCRSRSTTLFTRLLITVAVLPYRLAALTVRFGGIGCDTPTESLGFASIISTVFNKLASQYPAREILRFHNEPGSSTTILTVKERTEFLDTFTAKILPHLFANPVHASDFMRSNLLVAFPAHRVDLNLVILHDQA